MAAASSSAAASAAGAAASSVKIAPDVRNWEELLTAVDVSSEYNNPAFVNGESTECIQNFLELFRGRAPFRCIVALLKLFAMEDELTKRTTSALTTPCSPDGKPVTAEKFRQLFDQWVFHFFRGTFAMQQADTLRITLSESTTTSIKRIMAHLSVNLDVQLYQAYYVYNKKRPELVATVHAIATFKPNTSISKNLVPVAKKHNKIPVFFDYSDQCGEIYNARDGTYSDTLTTARLDGSRGLSFTYASEQASHLVLMARWAMYTMDVTYAMVCVIRELKRKDKPSEFFDHIFILPQKNKPSALCDQSACPMVNSALCNDSAHKGYAFTAQMFDRVLARYLTPTVTNWLWSKPIMSTSSDADEMDGPPLPRVNPESIAALPATERAALLDRLRRGSVCDGVSFMTPNLVEKCLDLSTPLLTLYTNAQLQTSKDVMSLQLTRLGKPVDYLLEFLHAEHVQLSMDPSPVIDSSAISVQVEPAAATAAAAAAVDAASGSAPSTAASVAPPSVAPKAKISAAAAIAAAAAAAVPEVGNKRKQPASPAVTKSTNKEHVPKKAHIESKTGTVVVAASDSGCNPMELIQEDENDNNATPALASVPKIAASKPAAAAPASSASHAIASPKPGTKSAVGATVPPVVSAKKVVQGGAGGAGHTLLPKAGVANGAATAGNPVAKSAIPSAAKVQLVKSPAAAKATTAAITPVAKTVPVEQEKSVAAESAPKASVVAKAVPIVPPVKKTVPVSTKTTPTATPSISTAKPSVAKQSAATQGTAAVAAAAPATLPSKKVTANSNHVPTVGTSVAVKKLATPTVPVKKPHVAAGAAPPAAAAAAAATGAAGGSTKKSTVASAKAPVAGAKAPVSVLPKA